MSGKREDVLLTTSVLLVSWVVTSFILVTGDEAMETALMVLSGGGMMMVGVLS